DLVFGHELFQPSTSEGMRLLAHELVHVVQQTRATDGVSPAAGALVISNPNHWSEQIAETAATDVIRGRTIQPGISVARLPMLQRQHQPGGPYHPPEGIELRCTDLDDCSTLSTKINYLKHTIHSHEQWDVEHPNPNYPGGRHAQEIAELTNA